MSTSYNNLSVSDLRKAANLKEKIEALEKELSHLLGGAGSGTPAAGKRGGGGMSASGRAAIIAAQKARWAKFHAANGSSKPGPKPGRKKKGGMSAAGRAAIAAAQRARWAKAKAGKAK